MFSGDKISLGYFQQLTVKPLHLEWLTQDFDYDSRFSIIVILPYFITKFIETQNIQNFIN